MSYSRRFESSAHPCPLGHHPRRECLLATRNLLQTLCTEQRETPSQSQGPPPPPLSSPHLIAPQPLLPKTRGSPISPAGARCLDSRHPTSHTTYHTSPDSYVNVYVTLHPLSYVPYPPFRPSLPFPCQLFLLLLSHRTSNVERRSGFISSSYPSFLELTVGLSRPHDTVYLHVRSYIDQCEEKEHLRGRSLDILCLNSDSRCTPLFDAVPRHIIALFRG